MIKFNYTQTKGWLSAGQREDIKKTFSPLKMVASPRFAEKLLQSPRT